VGPQEITAFLDRDSPALVGVVATTRADGFPHTVPVWYRWDGHAVRVWTHEERLWVRNLRRDPRIAFSVQEAKPPYAAVTMRGHAEISTAGAETDDEIRRITRRYLAADELEEYVTAWSHLRTIVTIRPAAIRAWSRGY
jgi:PPOX class probable F420-dependent enzyme